MQGQMLFFSSLKKGDHVEITRPGRTSFYPAVVLRRPAKIKHLVFVEYQTIFSPAEEGQLEPSKRLTEYVNAANVRPKLPLELNACFKVGDFVDAYREKEWLPGRVKEIVENSRYLVTFEGGEGRNVKIEQCNLRLHRRWVDGSWVPPLHAQCLFVGCLKPLERGAKEKQAEMENQPVNMRFKIKYTRKSRESISLFKKGDVVEVCSDEEGYKGAWFVATIVDSTGNDGFLVEYRDLTTDDGSKLLQEVADVSHMRPLPPQIPSVGSFKQLQEVDAWYNDGWWEGKILKVLNRGEYLVLFMPNKEMLKIEHSKLRLHQDWINRKWVMGSKWCQKSSQLPKTCGDVMLKSKCCGNKLVFKFPKSTDMAKKSRKVMSKAEDSVIPLDAKFSEGTKVEVRSDEEGYQGAWYTATVVGLTQNGKYLVEYHTLKTDDLMEQLKEEADASDIRPYPPDINHLHQFALSEWVDSWYNEGWWVGQVSCVLPDSKYRVYFWPTNEDLEFDHCDLRAHQEWTNGKWTVTS